MAESNSILCRWRNQKLNEHASFSITYLLRCREKLSHLVILPKNDKGAIVMDNLMMFDFHCGEGSYCRLEEFQSAFKRAVRCMESSLHNIASSLGLEEDEEEEKADDSVKEEDGVFNSLTTILVWAETENSHSVGFVR
jgi:hypothetical protein